MSSPTLPTTGAPMAGLIGLALAALAGGAIALVARRRAADQPVIKPAPGPRRPGTARHGRKPAGHRHPPGWVPPGTRTAAQAACG